MDSQSSSKRKTGDIIPVTILKRKKDDTEITNACIFCQTGNAVDLCCSSEEGKTQVVEAAIERKELNDIASSTTIERILRATATTDSEQNLEFELKWHHACYSKFTDRGKLSRLRKKHEGNETTAQTSLVGSDQVQMPSMRSHRSHAIDWKFCMFCQGGGSRNIRNVSTMELSRKIMHLAELDLIMRVRLANVSDLVASEGKYHLQCWVEFQRKVCKVNKSEPGKKDMCLDRLCAEVMAGLEQGHVYDMGSVWLQYVKNCKLKNVQIPQAYTTRRKTFYDDVQKILGERAGFVRPIDPKACLLIYPSDKSNFVIADHLTTAMSDDDAYETDELVPLQNNALQELVHSALHIRNELDKSPGHNAGWGGIDQDHVNKVIPDSLYLFLSILLGGIDALDCSPSSQGKLHNQTCSIAQDIVFSVSKKQKLTPKHIALGLTLHQATRSEKLVDLFHAAGHTIGIDTIRRIDTTIAADILKRYENGNVYVSCELVPYSPGHIVLASCDNIDVLEETIDGKNTFHCTQMMLWQRGPPNRRPDEETKIGRARTLAHGSLEKFHKLDHACLPGERPTPVFHPDLEIQAETWFNISSEQIEARLKNIAWILVINI